MSKIEDKDVPGMMTTEFEKLPMSQALKFNLLDYFESAKKTADEAAKFGTAFMYIECDEDGEIISKIITNEAAYG